MHKNCVRLTTVLVVVSASGCQFDHDTVDPGYYGTAGQGTSQSSSPGTSSQSSSQGSTTTPPAAGSTSPGTVVTPSGGSGTTATGGTVAAGGTTAEGGRAAPSNNGSGGMSMMAAAGGTGGAPDSAAAGGAAGGGTTEPAGPCDMSGRWLSTVHYVTDAIGQLQYGHMYVYYEIQQQGGDFMITKGLHCGDDAVGGGAFAVTIDLKPSWPTVATKVNYVGRKGTSVMGDGGCAVDLEKWYIVRGATVPHYLDPSIPLPNADQKATDTTPGWEDWDNDGNPGVTGSISGVVTGLIFTAPRFWTSLTGTVPSFDSAFKLPMKWQQEQNVMAFDGSSLLSMEAVNAADASLHFAEFYRLAPDQVTGDDAAICKSVTALAPMLTPAGAGT